MSSLGDRLKELRSEKGKTLNEMAKETGLTPTAISNYENGIRYPRRGAMEILTDYFNVETDYTTGKSDVRNALNFEGIYNEGYKEAIHVIMNHLTIPVYSRLSCGTGTWVDEKPEDIVAVPDCMMFHGRAFANFAEGDSMEPGIHNGDVLIFQEAPDIESGLIGSFSLNGQYYCKRLRKLPDGSCWLFSDNPAYDPIPIGPDDDFRVLGLYKMKLSKEQ